MLMVRLRFHLALLAGFLALTLVLTYPLVTQIATHIPGSYLWAFDEYTFLWNIWWFKQSILQLNQSPLATDTIFYPIGINFALYTFTFFNAAVALPLAPFLPLPLISNLITLFAFTLSGYGTYLLARRLMADVSLPRNGERVRDGASIVAGIAYAFTTSKFMSGAIGHYNFMGTEWIPFCLLYYIRALSTRKARDAALCGLFLALAMYVEMNFGVFLVLAMALHALFTSAWRAARWPALIRLGIVMGLTGGLIFLPVLAPVVREFANADYALKGWGDALKLSVDLLGFVSPSAISSWAGLDWTQEQMDVVRGAGRFADVNTVFLGYATLVLALGGLLAYRRQAAAWAASAAVFALLALGPLLQIGGRSLFDFDGVKVNFPLPFIIFHYIPIVQANRVPNRFSVVLVLCLALLVGYAALWLGRQAAARWRGRVTVLPAVLVAVLVVGDHLVVPLPLTDARVPDFYARLAQEPGDFSILQLPLGWRNSFGTLGAEDTRVQYYQTVHGKHILGGNTSRNAPFKFDYYQSLPVVSSLLMIEDYKKAPDEQRAFDREYAAEFVRFFDLRYLVVHPAVPGRKPYEDTRQAALDYLLDVLPLEKVADTGDLLVYRIAQTALPATVGIDCGEPTSRPYRAEGWDAEEEIAGRRANWANARQSRVLVRLPAARDYALHFAAMPLPAPGIAQTVTAIVNGQTRLPPVTLAAGWQEYEVSVPGSALRNGMNEVAFEFAYTRTPHDVIGNDDMRPLAAAFDWIEWRPR
ncbi:MAG: hypothetical protein HZB53_04985 [Chloroflexi bacterium]|nr:hypothetical protein [Chloroflexota bacterium]